MIGRGKYGRTVIALLSLFLIVGLGSFGISTSDPLSCVLIGESDLEASQDVCVVDRQTNDCSGTSFSHTTYYSGDCLPDVEVEVGEDGSQRASHQVIASIPNSDATSVAKSVDETGLIVCAVEPIASNLYDNETTYLITYNDNDSAEQAGSLLCSVGIASAVEPNYVSELSSDDLDLSDDFASRVDSADQDISHLAKTSINDEDASLQWQLSFSQAFDAWDIAKAQGSVTVAVIDSGVDTDHPDLVDNLLLDHAKNTTTDAIGASAVEDTMGHGTSVIGVVAASANNEIGVAGVSYNAKVLPVKAVSDSGKLYNSDIIEGLTYITDLKQNSSDKDMKNIRVINISCESNYTSESYKRAVEQATDAGILVVAAAGNGNGGSVKYPAAYDVVVGVSSLKESSDAAGVVIAPTSNIGPEIDLCAPGAQVYTTKYNSTYGYRSGTSFASPMVAGAAALLFSINMDATPDFVETVLEESAFDLGTEGKDDLYGYGAVDMVLAAYEMLGYEPTIVQATCTEDGYYAFEIDGTTYQRITHQALGHDSVVSKKAVEPTCTEEGLTEEISCQRCKKVLTEQEPVEALGHDWSEWETVLEPTATEEGLKERTCSRCDETEKVRLESEIERFVERLYENVLGRTADEDGMTAQIEGMKTSGAAQITFNFYNSDEFKAKACGMSNAEIVENVYQTLLGRAADETGKAMWVGYLENGMSACALVAGFAESDEFRAMCADYGVDAGSADWLRANKLESRDKAPGVTSFVYRLYTIVLNRAADVAGLNTQCQALIDGAACWDMATRFFNSQEYINFGKSDTEFVADCYKAMMNREGSSDEIAAWVDRMTKEGMTRVDVVKGFCQSDEFEAICQSCGMTSGMR